MPQCIRERKGSPLAGTLAGSEQGVVDVHGGLAAPQRHALPHLHRLLPVARVAAAASHVPVSYAPIFCALGPSGPDCSVLLATAGYCAVVASHLAGLASYRQEIFGEHWQAHLYAAMRPQ